MKILYLTNTDPKSQGDFQEVSILHGLRTILGSNIIDYPRKKIMYGDFSESPKEELHGIGFTLYNNPIYDLTEDERDFDLDDIDVVIYGVTEAYGMKDDPKINQRCKNIWYLDGHDHGDILKTPCFKRECYANGPDIYPTGFGIPEDRLRPLNFNNKTQLFQQTAPKYSSFGPMIDIGPAARKFYTFTDEEKYYDDMAQSWFGLTCMKGGWDSLRHYEIIAAGTCLLFRDYHKKPPTCAPQHLPTYSYSTEKQLDDIIKKLLPDGKPSPLYIRLVLSQRKWLLEHGTTTMRAINMVKTIIQRMK